MARHQSLLAEPMLCEVRNMDTNKIACQQLENQSVGLGNRQNWRKFLSLFLLVILLDTGLRVTGLTFNCMYLDEAFQTLCDSTGQPLPLLIKYKGEPVLFRFDKPHPLNEVLAEYTRNDPLCPPLYGILLNRWRLVFGDSDGSLRGFSVPFSVLANAGLMAFAAALFGPAVGLVAGLVQATSPFDINLSQEARMYTLELFFAIISMASFYALLQSKTNRRKFAWSTVYALSSWAMIGSHYTSAFTALFQAVFGLMVCWWRRDKNTSLWLIGAGATCLLMWCPWIPFVIHSASLRNNGFYVARTPSWTWPFYGLFVLAPRNWIGFLTGGGLPTFLMPVFATAAIIMLAAAKQVAPYLRSAFKPKDWVNSNQAFSRWFLILWMSLPLIFLWLADVVESRKVIQVYRYSNAVAPAVYIFTAMGVLALWHSKKRRLALSVLALHAALLMAIEVYTHTVEQRQNWRMAASYIESHVPPEDIVLVSEYYDMACLDRYLDRPVRQIAVGTSMGQEYIDKCLAAVPNLQHFWVSASGTGVSVTAIIPPNYVMTDKKGFGHYLYLMRYERK